MDGVAGPGGPDDVEELYVPARASRSAAALANAAVSWNNDDDEDDEDGGITQAGLSHLYNP